MWYFASFEVWLGGKVVNHADITAQSNESPDDTLNAMRAEVVSRSRIDGSYATCKAFNRV